MRHVYSFRGPITSTLILTPNPHFGPNPDPYPNRKLNTNPVTPNTVTNRNPKY